MELWQSLSGMVRIQILSADPMAFLASLYRKGIPVENVTYTDELTVIFSIHRHDEERVCIAADKSGAEWKVLERIGLFWKLYALRNRKLLLFGLTAILAFTLFLPTRIYFIEVEGNVQVADKYILEAAAKCGLKFGTGRQSIRSEKIKNALLGAIPELEWVGINTAGCVATISVRERQRSTPSQQTQGVSSIIATRDGIIQDMTVTAGSAACKVGQAVKAGQILISGYTDCGISIRAERAQGEIYATTSHNLTFVMPQTKAMRGAVNEKKQKYSIIIGKKRINFYKGSGILDTGCVKMYEERSVTLPGGFLLPVTFVKESWYSFEEAANTATVEDDTQDLMVIADAYLRSQMIAGSILSKQETCSQSQDTLCLVGKYGCLEMIGRERSEEIVTP